MVENTRTRSGYNVLMYHYVRKYLCTLSIQCFKVSLC